MATQQVSAPAPSEAGHGCCGDLIVRETMAGCLPVLLEGCLLSGFEIGTAESP